MLINNHLLKAEEGESFSYEETPNTSGAFPEGLPETLGLPRGVMRGVLTLTLLFMVVLLEIFTIRFENFETRIGDFMVAFQMMLSFYFGSKVMHHLTSVDERKNAASAKTAEVIEKHRIQESQKTGQPATTSGNSEKDFEDEKAVG